MTKNKTPPSNVVAMPATAAPAKKPTVRLPDGEIQMNLRCTFTQAELLERSKQLAEANRQRAELENDKKRAMDEYKSRISNVELNVSTLAEKVTTGYEFRDVACRVEYDRPAPGKKLIIRLDTSEEVGVHDMNNDEKQLKLSLINQAQGDGASAPTSAGK
jgi:hypothetical protein